MIRILIVDDHELVRAGLSRMLADEEDITVVGVADNGERALELVRETRVDVVLMDVRMPGMGGLEAMKRMLRFNEHLRVIAVTAMAEEPFPSRLMAAGASAFLTKGAEIREVVEAIRAVHRGQRYISPGVAQQMALHPYEEAEQQGVFTKLSEREMQIAMMIANCHKVQDIADRLCLSPKTVNTYRYRMFEKLNVSSDVELTHLALRHGVVDGNNIGE